MKKITGYWLLWLCYGILTLLIIVLWWTSFKFGKDETIEVLSWDVVSNLTFRNLTGDLYFSPWIFVEQYTWFFSTDLNWNLINWNWINDSLDIYMYQISYVDVENEIIRQSNEWSDVRLILENKKFVDYGFDYDDYKSYLTQEWIEVINDEEMKTNFNHAKALIFDDSFLIQTANLTYSAFKKNNEIFYRWADEIIKNWLKYSFHQDWKGEEIDENLLPTELIVCNINCREKIEWILNSAQRSIKIHTQYITDTSILNILKSKIENNQDFKMKLLVGENQDKLKISVLNDLYSRFENINNWDLIYKIKTKWRYVHTKSILVDDEILIVWSMNLSSNSLDNNREFWIVLVNDNHIQKYLNFFNKDRENN